MHLRLSLLSRHQTDLGCSVLQKQDVYIYNIPRGWRKSLSVLILHLGRIDLLMNLQSLYSRMKSSVIGACTCLVLSIDSLASLRSKLARMSFGFFGLGCTTEGEHHVIASFAGTCSMVSFCSNSSSRFWSGSVNRYGTLGFWARWVLLIFHWQGYLYFLAVTHSSS